MLVHKGEGLEALEAKGITVAKWLTMKKAQGQYMGRQEEDACGES